MTNEKGEARIAIPRSYFKGHLPRVIVRLNQPGMQDVQGRWERPFNGPWADSRVVRLFPKKGSTLYFQVQETSGDPVRATFGWRETLNPTKRGSRSLFANGQFGAGWYVLNVEADCDVDAWAWKSGVGGGALLAVKSDVDVLGGHKLVFRAESRLRGQIKSLGGTGIMDLPMFVRKQGSEWVPQRPKGLFGVQQGKGVGPKGLEFGWCRTDEGGRFELQGLAPGSYEVLVMSSSFRRSDWSLLPGELAQTSDDSSALNFTRPIVRVQLLNSAGEAWDGGREIQKADGYSRHWKRQCNFSDWPESPQLLVRNLATPEPTSLRFWLRSPAFWSDNHALISEISPGAYYAVQVIGGPFQGHVQVIQAPADGAPIKLAVKAGDRKPLGKLRVNLKHRGHKIVARKWFNDFGLWIADFETGVPLVTRIEFAQGPPEFSLPEGKYRVVLEGRSLGDSHHGTLMQPRSAGHAEAIVRIESATEKNIELDMDRGGFLNITLKGESTPADLAALRRRYKQASEDSPWLLEAANKAHLKIFAPNFIPEVVKFKGRDMEGTPAEGIHIQSHWPLGKTQKSEMLPAGTYELIATMPGGREFRKTIEIKPSGPEDLVLDFSDQ
ncbi:MAG: hypothetical protein GY930_02005 [bacterium]|nr:hypothetical protein [bacterium]